MHTDSRCGLLAFLSLLICCQTISSLNYNFPNRPNDIYASPGYSLGTLLQGFTLDVKINFPVNAGTITIANIVVELYKSQTQTLVATLTSACSSPSDCVYTSGLLAETTSYYLKVADDSNSDADQIDFFYLSAITYNSSVPSYVGSPNYQEILKLTEVARTRVVKLLYFNGQTVNHKFTLYPVPESAPGSGTPDTTMFL